ncbi:MAG: hypothetical protein ACM32F_05790, partial [Betaproteobacteria bacterium]
MTLVTLHLRSLLVALAASCLLAACGGGGGGGGTPAPAPAPAPGPTIPEPPSGGFAPSGPTAAPTAAPTDAQAIRFLAQSTFGATT